MISGKTAFAEELEKQQGCIYNLSQRTESEKQSRTQI